MKTKAKNYMPTPNTQASPRNKSTKSHVRPNHDHDGIKTQNPRSQTSQSQRSNFRPATRASTKSTTSRGSTSRKHKSDTGVSGLKHGHSTRSKHGHGFDKTRDHLFPNKEEIHLDPEKALKCSDICYISAAIFVFIGTAFLTGLHFHFGPQSCSEETMNASSSKYNTYQQFDDCLDAKYKGYAQHQIYQINPQGGDSFLVWCDMKYDGGGWTVIQRRGGANDSFSHTWQRYKDGFGSVLKDHWLGNDQISRLTYGRNQELLILFTMDGAETWAQYRNFSVGLEESSYKLDISGLIPESTTGDGMTAEGSSNNGMKFSTFDRDNDLSGTNCAKTMKGGWWYSDCGMVNLNGVWKRPGGAYGLTWVVGGRQVIACTMMVRTQM